MVQPRPLPPIEAIREALDYNPETGRFTWLKRGSIRITIGDEAGSIVADGYRRINVCKQSIAAGRLAYYMMTGSEPSGVIDHINGDRLDNRWVNLRDVPQAVNVQAARLNGSRQTSSYRGVSRVLPGPSVRKGANWQASITAFGKRYSLGRFDTEEEAAAAYEEARARLHAANDTQTYPLAAGRS